MCEYNIFGETFEYVWKKVSSFSKLLNSGVYAPKDSSINNNNNTSETTFNECSTCGGITVSKILTHVSTSPGE